MKNILMYTSSYCPFCANAERLLFEKGFDITEKIRIDEDPAELEKMINITGKRTVPQIFIDNVYIGGFDELRASDLSGKLDKLLK
ncbi:glutaredoxin 3 [Methylophilaceae bacterium]|jgi:glutaredoxin 3|nr:glutaredoxin 3 [Methylophilaceae bacterium]|tara:strand:+ start:384 stop:638 length:255 start_codon:yes stop_codon:yes gene_type:complete